MSKANQSARYFTRRGVQDITINYDDDEFVISLNVPNNRQIDDMMEEFTDMSTPGVVNVRGADLLEARFIRFLKDLPFDVPYDMEMKTFDKWSEASEDQKKIALSQMDPGLRDAINARIIGESELTEEEAGN